MTVWSPKNRERLWKIPWKQTCYCRNRERLWKIKDFLKNQIVMAAEVEIEFWTHDVHYRRLLLYNTQQPVDGCSKGVWNTDHLWKGIWNWATPQGWKACNRRGKLLYILCSWELLHNFSRNTQNRNDQNVNMLLVVSIQLGTPSFLYMFT